MKKLLILMMALAMTLSLAACGVDNSAAADAFNSTNDQFNSVVDLFNNNLDKMDQETQDAMQSVSDALAAFKAEIESEDLKQDRADAIVGELKAYPDKIAQLKTKVEALIESAGYATTEEQTAVLTEIEQGLADVYAQFADVYDMLNEETQAFVDEIGQQVTDIGGVLDGSTVLSSAEAAEQFIEGSQGVLEAAQTGWAEIEAQLGE